MLRFLLRFFGILCLACAFAALIVDGTRSLGADALVLTSLAEAMTAVAPAKLIGLELLLRSVSLVLWEAVAATLLRLPLWFAFGALGGLLFAITARRRAPVGFSSR